MVFLQFFRLNPLRWEILLMCLGFGLSTHAQVNIPAAVVYHDAQASDQDDMCIWIHPTPSQSAVIASDKAANKLFVYDLSGNTLQTVALSGKPGNIDVRYNFPLSGSSVDIVGYCDRTSQEVVFYQMDSTTRQLTFLSSFPALGEVLGFCLYHSPNNGKYYAILTSESGSGVMWQWELVDNGRGGIDGIHQRTWINGPGGLTEGVVADDETGLLFAGSEDNGIYKYDADPADPNPAATLVAAVGTNGLTADVEGLTIYYAANGQGYLIASSQGSDDFKVYDRQPPHNFVSTFSVQSASTTDGIDVTNLNLGGSFPQGLFTLHNGSMIFGIEYSATGLLVDTGYWNPRTGGTPPPPAEPHISVIPADFDFGVHFLNTAVLAPFVVENTGNADLTVEDVSLIDNAENQFSIASGGGGFSLESAETREISLQFLPTSAGEKTAFMRLLSNDPDESPLDIALSGTGIKDISQSQTVVFAAFGDYGDDNADEQAVADLVNTLLVDFIVTTGDNSYGNSFDQNVGQYYSDYIGNYTGSYGSGSPVNRFFPSLGDHDWNAGISAYEAFFTLPGQGIPSSHTSGNERYYDFIQGPVHFFVLDSDVREPDGTDALSIQAQWLQTQLAASTAPWQIVISHSPPYSSGGENTESMRWPFEDWGADAVLSGDDHFYERVLRDDNKDNIDMPYFITGLGGRSMVGFGDPIEGSAVRFNGNFGTMKITASETEILFEFYSIDDSSTPVDAYTLQNSSPPAVPDIRVTPDSHDFGEVSSDSSALQAFTIHNDGTASLSVIGTVLSGANASAFLIESGSAPFDVSPGSTATLTVRFAPAMTGANTATLEIASNDPDENPLEIALSGSGVAPTFTVDIIPGWNLLSLPLDPADRFYQSVYPGATDNTLFFYDNGYLSGSELSTCKGFWLQFSASQAVEISGSPITQCVIDLAAGWNMIGGVSDTVPLASVSDPDGIIDGATLYEYSGSYTPSQEIAPGKGYWILASLAGQITIASTAPTSAAKVDLPDWDGYPQLQIRESLPPRRSQTLYFNVSAISPQTAHSYRLPPIPPAGGFDARFADDYRAISGMEGRILIQADHAPLTITPRNLPQIAPALLALQEVDQTGKETQYLLEEGRPFRLNSPGMRQLQLIRIPPAIGAFELAQNYPNPFNPGTTIHFQLPEPVSLQLEIFNLQGQHVRTLLTGDLPAGSHRIHWDATDDRGEPVTTGIYFYRLQTAKFARVRKMLLLK